MKTDIEKSIAIVFSTDDNYFNYLSVVINSIIKKSSEKYTYKIYIFESNVCFDKKNSLKEWISQYKNFSLCYIDMNKYVSYFETLTLRGHISSAAYFRLLIDKILIDEDKVVYLDCDVILNRDIAELYNFDISQYCLAAVKDFGAEIYLKYNSDFMEYISSLGFKYESTYFNSGVLVMNLKKIRNENYSNLMFRVAEMNTKYFHDQNVLNVVFQDSVKFLDFRWNFQWSLHNENVENVAIIHYCGNKKPWDCLESNPLSKYWVGAAKTSFFSKDFRELSCEEGSKIINKKGFFRAIFKENFHELYKYKYVMYKIISLFLIGEKRNKVKSMYKYFHKLSNYYK